MLFAPASASKPTRLQGAWVTEQEVSAVAGFTRGQRDVVYEQAVEGLGLPPTEADLRALKDEGYVGVVNLRNDGEPEQPLGTAAEGERVRSLGMDYVHYGVGSAPWI